MDEDEEENRLFSDDNEEITSPELDEPNFVILELQQDERCWVFCELQAASSLLASCEFSVCELRVSNNYKYPYLMTNNNNK